jgi:pimeloyl-ACP methyl ester carboxylesterase
MNSHRLRRAGILMLGPLAGLYVLVFVLLVIFQRDILFIGNTRLIGPPTADSIYRARVVSVPDGGTLTIWQATLSRAGAATIVFFYGNASNLTDFAQTGIDLHGAGYGVVLASYRGYSGNPGHPSEEGLMADARAILATIPRHDGPVVVWGHSLGSGVAARMAAEGRADALILESPYTSVANAATRKFPIYPVRWFIEDTFDTLALVPRIKVPVLILHGVKDPVIPFDMGETLAGRFGKQATFVPFPGVGHEPHRANLASIVVPWLLAHASQAGARNGR